MFSPDGRLWLAYRLFLFFYKLFITVWRYYMKIRIKRKLNEAWAIKGKVRGQRSGASSLSGPHYEEAGAAYKALQAGEELHGWDKYAQLITEAYIAAPKETPEGLKMYEMFEEHIIRMHKKIENIYNIKYIDAQPYASAEEMAQKMKATGDFEISSQFLQTDDPEQVKINLQNRAVHDFFGHLRARAFEKDPSVIGKFSLHGELRSYNNQLKISSPKMVPLLFTLIVGQAAHYFHKGYFPELKLVALPGFDYNNVGRVEGYTITKDGDLVKK